LHGVERSKPYPLLIASGIVSGSLYLLLYVYESAIMATFTRTDGWYPALPVIAAFVYSFAHGAFAASFWEVLGVRGRKA